MPFLQTTVTPTPFFSFALQERAPTATATAANLSQQVPMSFFASQATDFLPPRKMFFMCELKRLGLFQGRNGGISQNENPFLFNSHQMAKMQNFLPLDQY